MTRMLLQRPQPSRNSVSPLVEAPKPNLKPRLTHRLHPSLPLSVPAGGWRRVGGPPPASCGGWWNQIGDRTRRPDSLVLRSGYLRSALNSRSLRNRPRSLGSRLSALLSRLSRPASLPGRIEGHLPHLAHAVLRRPGENKRLVDPRLQLIQRRNGAPGDDPVLSVVTHRLLDTREFTIEEGGKSALSLDLRPPSPRTETRGAP